MSRLHWIATPAAGRLAIAARPRGDEWLADDIARWQADGLNLVVSLLEPAEIAELGLRREAELCQAAGIELTSFPIPDRCLPPSRPAAWQLVSAVAKDLAAGSAVAIHCRAGIGRSAVIAACVLICMGIDADQALAMIGAARGLSVPDTEEQREWVLDFVPS
jgi:protein-tyrosine phosphatase